MTAWEERASLQNSFRNAHAAFEQGMQDEFLGQGTEEIVQEERDVCMESLAWVCTVSSVFSSGRLCCSCM